MFFTSSENVYSQNPCPPGYGTPTTSIIDICGGACQIEVTWCCAPGITSLFPRMYIHEIKFLPDPYSCPCIQWAARPIPYPDVPTIPMAEVISGIISSPGVNCFNNYLYMIDSCGGPNLQYVEVSNGGCYEYITTLDYIGYVQCGNPQITECHLYYTICKQYINGEWVLKVTPSLPRIPTFPCENPDCFGMCDILTD
jgi:hypothetical protein